MSEQIKVLPDLIKKVCVDLSTQTIILPPTEWRPIGGSVGDWFKDQSGFALPDWAETLGVNQAEMQVSGNPEKHLLVFKSGDELIQVLMKYGQRWSKGKSTWFPSAVGISGIDDGRLVALAWQLKNSDETPIWRPTAGAVSYRERIIDKRFVESSTVSLEARTVLFKLPWFSQKMLDKAGHARALAIREGVLGSGIVLGDQSVCANVGFSIIRGDLTDTVQSKRISDSWQLAVQKQLKI